MFTEPAFLIPLGVALIAFGGWIFFYVKMQPPRFRPRVGQIATLGMVAIVASGAISFGLATLLLEGNGVVNAAKKARPERSFGNDGVEVRAGARLQKREGDEDSGASFGN